MRTFTFLFLLTVALVGFGFPDKAMAEHKFPYVGQIKADDIVIRAGQSSNFEDLGRLGKGGEVVVVGQSYSWLKIKLPVQAASFVSADFVQDIGGGIGEATGQKVNVRAGPGTTKYVLGQLTKGEKVRILEKKDRWYKIEPVDQSYGWLLAEYVVFKSASIPPARVVQAPPAPPRELLTQKAAAPVLDTEQQDSSKRVITAGMVHDLADKALSDSIRHKLIVDDKTVYLLKGFRRVMDGFIRHKVKIEGEVQEGIKSEYPVILVTKISLVL